MKPQTFSALLIAAIVTSAFAIVSYASNNRVARPKVAGAPLVAGLAANAPRIARVEVSQGDKQVALALEGGTWVLASRGNYPARADVVPSIQEPEVNRNTWAARVFSPTSRASVRSNSDGVNESAA